VGEGLARDERREGKAPRSACLRGGGCVRRKMGINGRREKN